MIELAEGSPSDKLRPVYVQIKLLEETFTDDLENTQSLEYETKRKKMQETVCTNTFILLVVIYQYLLFSVV